MRTTRIMSIAAAAAMALALTACGSSGEPAGNADGTAPLLSIGALLEPTSWDPAQANEGHLAPIYQSLYDTLIKREPNGELSPMLATEWTWSDDELDLTLQLRDDVTFTDGASFDAEAVVANIEHFKKANGPMLGNLSAVESAEVADPHTVVLHLSAPDPDLPESLANAGGYMGSPAALADGSIDTAPAGSGPYTLDTSASVAGSTIAFARNDDYWGEQLPYDRVEFQLLADETARLNALTSGQVNFTILNRAASAVQATGSGLNMAEDFTVNWAGVLFFDRDGEIQPEFADPRVRQALSLAIDREALVEVGWEGLGEVTSQVYGPESNAFDEELESAYEYDPARAKELLEQAGATDMTITFPTSSTFEPVLYDAIFQNWKDVGVTVKAEQWGPGEAIPSMMRGEYAVSFFTLAQRSDWGTVKFLLQEGSSWNPLGSTDPELQQLIDAYPAASEEERPQVAREINTWIVENAWFAPLARPGAFNLWDDTVDVEVQTRQAVPSIYNFTPTGD
ncbi:ABC transporter substrate-binding protein [Nocardioides sp.]|uniref:ABC transporter substrate-binding protein n=1 Tax=Nocardioides sp. TaxID=35761 RepID=UPI00198F7895|nr:ABC transporter substrate-binding protein [Nocardioides sp.]MBC7278084.1 ABC transporter substrate-binding protein [Nocardioides sp.]